MADYPGIRKRLSWTVTDETQDPPALASPTAQVVLFGLRGATPTEKHYPADDEIVEDGDGQFHIDIDCPDPGTYFADIKATEGIVGATETSWHVTRPAFTAA